MENLHRNRTIESCIKTVVKNLVKLANKGNIPFLISWQTFGSVKKLGTEHTQEWFNNILEMDDNGSELQQAFVKDKLCLGKGEGKFDVDTSNIDPMSKSILYIFSQFIIS